MWIQAMTRVHSLQSLGMQTPTHSKSHHSQTYFKVYSHPNLINQKYIILVCHKGSQGRRPKLPFLFLWLKLKKKKAAFKNNHCVSLSFQILLSTLRSQRVIWMSTLSLANRGNSVFAFVFAFIWHFHTLYLKPLTEQWITDLGSGDYMHHGSSITQVLQLETLRVLINLGCY